MQWYIPITAIPGIGLIIMSTSTLLVSLNDEIVLLNLEKEKYNQIIHLKMGQLKRLNWAMVFLYTGVMFFLFSGLLAAFIEPKSLGVQFIMIGGVLVTLIAIGYLISFGFKSISIRQKHLSL
ncbi:MAG: hypothetical protein KAT15_23110 [Bacteroidales bacterium]|nr:hypothetical protein [Bacteroidales bacterium]